VIVGSATTLTQATLGSRSAAATQLVPCYPVKSAIEDWRAEHMAQAEDDEDLAVCPGNADSRPTSMSALTNAAFVLAGLAHSQSLTEAMKAQLARHSTQLLGGRKPSVTAAGSPGSSGVSPATTTSRQGGQSITDVNRPRAGSNAVDMAPPGVVWARLEPLNRQYERIGILTAANMRLGGIASPDRAHRSCAIVIADRQTSTGTHS